MPIVRSWLLAMVVAGCARANSVRDIGVTANDTAYDGARVWVALGLVGVLLFIGWLAGRLRRPTAPDRGSRSDDRD
jgi:hypothetical protein